MSGDELFILEEHALSSLQISHKVKKSQSIEKPGKNSSCKRPAETMLCTANWLCNICYIPRIRL